MARADELNASQLFQKGQGFLLLPSIKLRKQQDGLGHNIRCSKKVSRRKL